MSGCSLLKDPEQKVTGKLLGVWYEEPDGSKYEFTATGDLVLPHPRPDGGNTAKYRVIPTNLLKVDNAGTVSIDAITTLDAQALVLTNPSSGKVRAFRRDWAQTVAGKNRTLVLDQSLAAAKRFPGIAPRAKIRWVKKAPMSSESTWTTWSTKGIARYASAWDWQGIVWDGAPGGWNGVGDTAVFTVSFPRKVPSSTPSASVLPGQPRIPVGYSPSWQKYAAGQFVYNSRGLLYSLGGGYMFGVGIGKTEDVGFYPITSN